MRGMKFSNLLLLSTETLILIINIIMNSRPWIIYWILHSLYLLNHEATEYYDRIIDTLCYFQNPTGGFGGGPDQLAHG